MDTVAHIGLLPRTLTSIEWIPVDKLATIITEIIQSEHKTESSRTLVYNLVNPHPASWDSLLETMTSHLGLDGDSDAIVSLAEWIAELERYDRTNLADLASKPALKLLDVFKQCDAGNGDLRFNTRDGIKNSETMRRLACVGPEWMDVWMRQWDMQKDKTRGYRSDRG